MYQNISFIIAIVLLVPGIFMAFVPMLPALSYMFVVALLFTIVLPLISTGLRILSPAELLILFGITLFSILIDHLSGILGAKFGGAHTKSLFWGFCGGMLGTFVMPVIGSFVGLFLAVLFSELYYKKDGDKAVKSAGSALIGSVGGVIINVVLAVLFLISFFFFVV